MGTPAAVLARLKKLWKTEYTFVFAFTVLLGLLVHMPIMLSDIPNHDGLDSLYFDQNMVTSGRWFLTVACGISSYFTLPWLIGLLALTYLGLSAVCLTEVLEVKSGLAMGIISGLLVTFPSIASSFAYVYTLDGYMMALLFAIAAVLVTKKYKYGFLAGTLLLGCSMGIYQAYLPICVLLCLYLAVRILAKEISLKEKCRQIAPYLCMGVLSMAFYFVMLKLMLALQGKELDTYQGINGQENALAGTGLLDSLKAVFRDFGAFTLRGNVLYNNLFSAVALIVLVTAVAAGIVLLMKKKGWWKKPGFYAVAVVGFGLLPLICNYILIVSPELNYHLIMRYQWVFLLIIGIAFLDSLYDKKSQENSWTQWAVLLCGAILVFNYAVSDNIGYSNLEKKYEKTYAYCVRLLDRIENTPGYYQGIPVALVGVVGEEAFPKTDLSQKVTSGMIGLGGDWLLYTGKNYEKFIKNYLGATLNVIENDRMGEIYYSKEYQKMDSFPGPNSTKVVNGILYVHTENIDKTLEFED